MVCTRLGAANGNECHVANVDAKQKVEGGLASRAVTAPCFALHQQFGVFFGVRDHESGTA